LASSSNNDEAMTFHQDDIVLAARIKALAHPARLAIVRELQRVGGTGCCCGDIVRDLPLAQSTVSQHLKILREAGLIRGEIDGPRSCYCLDQAALAAVTEAVSGLARPGMSAESTANP
jgi:DNA-binding transcriptional ArsR family regulator